jgi:predicted nucleic acid-binding protein
VTLTFVDSGVLIAAARGTHEVSEQAFAILEDPDRTFASSEFVRLEVLPKAIYNQQADEAAFYETFFESVTSWASADNGIVEQALIEARSFGLAAMDALHVAAAVQLGADELVTTEKPTKPIHRTSSISTRSIHP